MKLINSWKQFQDIKKKKFQQFNEMVKTIDKDRPLTSEIRRKTYIPAV